MKNKNKLLAGPYLIWMAIFIIVPLGLVVYYAFTDANTGQFTFNNISRLSEYGSIFLDSIWLGLVAALICLLIGYPMAYFISQASPNRQRIYIMLIMLPMCMSFLLRTVAWKSLIMDTGIINNFLGLFGIEPLHMIRTNGAVVMGMVYNFLPYMILPLNTVLSKMDHRVIEAAHDLGANNVKTFFRVVLPLSVPGIISGITMVFVPAVSTFYISKQLGSTELLLIGDIIEIQFKNAYNPNLGAAMSLVLMLLILVSTGIMNRFADDDDQMII